MLERRLSSIVFPLDKGISLTGSRKEFEYVDNSIPLLRNEEFDRPKTSQFTILYLHGNGTSISDEDLESLLTHFASFFKTKIFSYDYPGTKESGYLNKTTRNGNIEEIIFRDAETVFKYITKENPSKKVLLIAHSIGTAPAIYLAERFKNKDIIKGLVLFSSFYSILSIALGKRLVNNTFLTRFDFFQNFKLMQKLKVQKNFPIMLFHGRDDDMINYINSVQLYDILTGDQVKEDDRFRLCIIKNVGHNSIFHHIPDLLLEIQQLLE